MKGDISDLEKFILLIIFGILVVVYSVKGIFTSNINPLIKLAPFYGLLIYIMLKDKFKK